MISPFLLKVTLLSVFFFLISTLSFAQSDCKLRKDVDGIRVYTCHVDSSRFKSIKAEFDISCSYAELEKIVGDVPDYTKWQFNTLEGKVLKTISTTEKIYRTVVEAPWPVSDRDMVVHMRMTRNEQELIITNDSEEGIAPAESDFIRVPFSHAQWTVTSSSKDILHVKYVMLIDPGGSVPAWLVNWTCANAPLQSFQKLKLLAEKK